MAVSKRALARLRVRLTLLGLGSAALLMLSLSRRAIFAPSLARRLNEASDSLGTEMDLPDQRGDISLLSALLGTPQCITGFDTYVHAGRQQARLALPRASGNVGGNCVRGRWDPSLAAAQAVRLPLLASNECAKAFCAELIGLRASAGPHARRVLGHPADAGARGAGAAVGDGEMGAHNAGDENRRHDKRQLRRPAKHSVAALV